MGVFDHAEYDGDIFILIRGLCNQQIQDGGQPPHWILILKKNAYGCWYYDVIPLLSGF